RRRRGDGRPVVTAPRPTRAITLEDPGQDREIAVRVADAAIVGAARGGEFHRAVTVEVTGQGSDVREVRPRVQIERIDRIAFREAGEVVCLVDVHADLPPHLGTGGSGEGELDVRADLRAAGIQGRDVVRVRGREDLLDAVAVEIADGDVLVVDARPIA